MAVSQSATLVQTGISQQLLDCHQILVPRQWILINFDQEEKSRESSKFSLVRWNISASTRWIGTKFSTDIHGSQTMNPNDFGDPQTFSLAPPWLSDGLPWNLVQTFMVPSGWIVIAELWLFTWCHQNFNFPNTLAYDQLPEKLMTVPSASAVLCF